MLIREQGSLVKLMRSERDPVSRRPRHSVIGTFRQADGPAKTLLALLDDDERAALTRWLSVQHDRLEQAQHRLVLDTAHRRLAELVTAIDAAAEHLSPDDATAIWHNLNEIARAMNRAGLPKPTRQRKAPDPGAGQGDLLARLV
jgi:hypothetical protein